MTEIALVGKKIGMTREFYKTGQLVPVTVLKVEKALRKLSLLFCAGVGAIFSLILSKRMSNSKLNQEHQSESTPTQFTSKLGKL